jgi:hypothetical protein
LCLALQSQPGSAEQWDDTLDEAHVTVVLEGKEKRLTSAVEAAAGGGYRTAAFGERWTFMRPVFVKNLADVPIRILAVWVRENNKASLKTFELSFNVLGKFSADAKAAWEAFRQTGDNDGTDETAVAINATTTFSFPRNGNVVGIRLFVFENKIDGLSFGRKYVEAHTEVVVTGPPLV